jgi:hypothetical protein
MSGGKHTPGPWYVSQVGLTNGGDRPITTEDERICTVDCQTPFKRGEGWQSECDVREANARLIAAAPDLLAALKALDAYWCEMLPDGPPADDADHWLHADSRAVWRAVRAAIAKAEGGAA